MRIMRTATATRDMSAAMLAGQFTRPMFSTSADQCNRWLLSSCTIVKSISYTYDACRKLQTDWRFQKTMLQDTPLAGNWQASSAAQSTRTIAFR
jgi:hypothetical protein